MVTSPINLGFRGSNDALAPFGLQNREDRLESYLVVQRTKVLEDTCDLVCLLPIFPARFSNLDLVPLGLSSFGTQWLPPGCWICSGGLVGRRNGIRLWEPQPRLLSLIFGSNSVSQKVPLIKQDAQRFQALCPQESTPFLLGYSAFDHVTTCSSNTRFASLKEVLTSPRVVIGYGWCGPGLLNFSGIFWRYFRDCSRFN
ncbi:hypothetical protein B0H14DRAFT_2661536 [Mycena olivaceomarginata]|nr:hypothetical protein B0H14DRAFT_2661536 [Mycena olivaceomarginata]